MQIPPFWCRNLHSFSLAETYKESVDFSCFIGQNKEEKSDFLFLIKTEFIEEEKLDFS